MNNIIIIQSILDFLDADEFIGNKTSAISKIVPFDESHFDSSALTWCHKKTEHLISKISHGTIIVSTEIDRALINDSCNYIFVKNPRMAFRDVLYKFFVKKESIFEVSPSAFIDPSVELSSEVSIGHNTVIESNCKIGTNVKISANTHIKENTVIQNNVQIGSNCTIGAVGFGYEKDDLGEYISIPHIGNVVICENVEIGNNTCIDRAVLGSTLIGKNVKIDNLVHIAHGVKIGENSLIIANAMVAGSCVIGKNVWLSPSASVLNKVCLGDDSLVGMGAVVLKNVPSHAVVVGNPAKPLKG